MTNFFWHPPSLEKSKFRQFRLEVRILRSLQLSFAGWDYLLAFARPESFYHQKLERILQNLFKNDLGSCQIHQIFVILKPMCIPWVKARLSKVFKNSHRLTTRCFWSWMIWTRGSRAGLQRGVGKWGTMAQCPQFMAMLIEKTNGFWTPKCLDHVLGASSFHTSWFFQHCRLHAQPGSCSRQLAGLPAAKQRRGTQASRESIWAQVLQSHA